MSAPAPPLDTTRGPAVSGGWRAYYADGSTLDSGTFGVADLPAEGMVGVIEFEEPPYRRIVDGGDWYWYEGGRWHASDTVWGEWVEPPKVACLSCLKRGVAMADDAWRAMQRRMIEDRTWP